MNKLLEAPCLYCGYDNDSDYWGAGTHDRGCPFEKIRGENARKEALPYIIRRWAAIVQGYRAVRVKRKTPD